MIYKCAALRGGRVSVSFWKYLDKYNVIQKVANPQTQTLPERPDWKGMLPSSVSQEPAEFFMSFPMKKT